MSERGQGPDPLPRPTARQLVIRSIGTVLVVAALVAGVLVVIDARDQPTDVEALVEQPRTVSYNRLSLQVPADWDLSDVDDCGHVQDDTLILGLAGVVTCPDGERDPEATDVTLSSLHGRMVAPAPRVRLRPVTLPSGLRAELGTTRVQRTGGTGAGNDPDEQQQQEEEESDDPPLRTTVVRVPSLDVQVVATSPDRKLVRGILNSAKRIPPGSAATRTAAYLFAAIDVPLTWEVNAVDCGVPTTDTIIAGHPGKPRMTRLPGRSCPGQRPLGVSDITLDSLDSAFATRWGVIASDPVPLLGGVKGLRGTKALPSGVIVTVMVVPSLRAIAVARSSDQALINQVLSTIHRAVPTPPDPEDDQPTTTPSPEPTDRPTLPIGVQTRTVRHRGVALSVPARWTDGDVRCGAPRTDTVVLGIPPIAGTGCPEPPQRPDVSQLVITRLYNPYGSLWQAAATDPVTLPSGLSGLQGTDTSVAGRPVSVLSLPTLDVIIVATAGTDDQDLIDGILTTTRPIG